MNAKGNGQHAAEPAPLRLPLTDRAVLAVSGPDSRHFLHNLLTANLETLAPGAGVPAALLTPQGKIIAEMLVFDASDDEPLFLIDVLAGQAEDLAARLAAYRLRAAVEIAVLPPSVQVAALFDAAPVAGEGIYAFPDPRHRALGQRLIGPADAIVAETAGVAEGARADYHARRLALGVPEAGHDYLPLDTFPHEALLDQLGGIDFRKGCYVGQEVVSRMEHKKMARTRAVPVRLLNGFGVIGGSEVRAGDTLLGRIGECIGDRGIAILRLDRLAESLAAGEEPRAGGVAIAIGRPDFVRFEVPGAPAAA